MTAVATELHPDLVSYIETWPPPWGRTVNHPLVRSNRMNSPEDVIEINNLYAAKVKDLEKSEKNRDWHTHIFLHERPYRAEALYDLVNSHDLKPKEYWTVLGEVWIDAKNIWRDMALWESLWGYGKNPHRKFAMTIQDRKALKLLPEEFTVWRGISHPEGMTGLSWTTSRDVALWFAHAGSWGAPHIAKGRIKRLDALVMFTSREEFEIVVPPDAVRAVIMKGLPAITSEEFGDLKAGLGWR